MYVKSFFFLLCISISFSTSAQKMSVIDRNQQVIILEGPDTVLVYQKTPKNRDGQYSRSNYVHPLYNLDGSILTEDFPSDHLHHRGIFWAWHQLYIDDQRIGDGWEIKDFSWSVEQVNTQQSKKQGQILATVLWKSPLWLDQQAKEQAFVKEETTITVYRRRKSYRRIDFKISLLALEANMTIGGSEDEKGYGGFSPRIKLAPGMVFQGPDGELQPTNLPLKAREWIDIRGPVGLNEDVVGMTIIPHPNNPGYPNPWILRAKGSMQNAVFPYPGRKPIPLSRLEPLILAYSLLIHDGSLGPNKISKIAKTIK